MTPIDADIAAVGRISAVPSILKVISETTGLRLALVARVTGDSWTACATLDRMSFGLNVGDKLEVTTTLCAEVRDKRAPIVVEHASREPEFCNHPTPKLYGFESYMSFPIYRKDGHYFGTLCALDSIPARLREDKTLSMMHLFAELVSLQLASEDDHTRDLVALADERKTGELREQFIAVLGHDLRTPLAAIIAGTDFLLFGKLADEQREVLEQLRKSGKRISRLVDDLLDFARGRLGDGIPMRPEQVDDVEDVVRQVVAEVRTGNRNRKITIEASNVGAAYLDPSRLAQLLSNLVANAVEHSAADEPIIVSVRGDAREIAFTVTNHGEPIPPEIAPSLFQPFYRGGRDMAKKGLGLGLFIASQIARAHGGTIEFTSDATAGTTFSVRLPRALHGS